MKRFSMLLMIIVSTLGQVSIAQSIPISEVWERLEVRMEEGFFPKDFESLIGFSAVIVKGKYGKLLSHGPFWGYVDGHDDTRESFHEKRNLPDVVEHEYSVPLSEYEILIDEVLLGDVEEGVLVYRTMEGFPSEGEQLIAKQSVDRLFFLGVNPDGKTYGTMGPAFILNNIDGVYAYEYLENYPDDISYLGYEFSTTMNVDELEEIIKYEVFRQREYYR